MINSIRDAASPKRLREFRVDIAARGALDFDGLAEEIEEIPTLYSIDTVNLDQAADKLFLEDIADYGRTIYQKI